MVRESRDNYILRKMREEKMSDKTVQQLQQENYLLRRNIHDLQEQLQKSYIRIKQLTDNPQQLELPL